MEEYSTGGGLGDDPVRALVVDEGEDAGVKENRYCGIRHVNAPGDHYCSKSSAGEESNRVDSRVHT